MSLSDHTPQGPVEVPIEALSADALSGVIDDFILREGTDYGAAESAHESKIKRIQKQLQAGDVKIVFDPESESVTLLTKQEWIAAHSKNRAP